MDRLSNFYVFVNLGRQARHLFVIFLAVTTKFAVTRLFLAPAMVAMVLGLAATANAEGPYANCGQAKADGVCNITTDSPWYSAKLDRDGDGYGCEC